MDGKDIWMEGWVNVREEGGMDGRGVDRWMVG